jgi:hypothetical protein
MRAKFKNAYHRVCRRLLVDYFAGQIMGTPMAFGHPMMNFRPDRAYRMAEEAVRWREENR